ncbi:MAG TPA: hypothetical protein VF832_07460 [Longimicrobiales bacterium]
MRLVATAVGGGLLALLGLALARMLLGGVLGFAAFVFALLFKVAIAALMIWLAVKLLKTLVKPPKEA